MFKDKFNEAVAINPLFLLPGETMDSARNALDDLMRNRPVRKEIKRESRSEPTIVKCYRGFSQESLNRDLIEDQGGQLILSPKYAQEQMFWFTNDLQSKMHLNDGSPIKFAKSYATNNPEREGFLLTYPLNCIKHYDNITYEDGTKSKDANPELSKRIDSTGEGRFRRIWDAIYELPEGWIFTWQLEKFIACTTELRIDKNMIKKVYS